MKRLFPLVVTGCLLTASLAQQKSARDYYEEAKKAGALPSLPYVCFRSTSSQNTEKEEKWDEPTFAMIGSSRQIADIIKRKAYERMTNAEREKLKALQGNDLLYMETFSHGIAAGDHIFDNANPSDPSRADWIFEGTVGDKKTPMKWEFNINWGTLRFRERLSGGADYLILYGQCELVDK